MNIKINRLLFCGILLFLFISCQKPDKNVLNRIFKSEVFDNSSRITKLNNNQFLIVGSKLVKLDSIGNIIWTKSSPIQSNIRDFIKLADNNFLMLTSSNVKNIELTKIDDYGNLLFSKTYNIDAYNVENESLIATSENKVLIAFTKIIQIKPKEFSKSIVLWKLDLNGNKLWEKTISNQYLNITKLAKLPNNTYLIATKTFPQNTDDYFIFFNVSQDGIVLWEKKVLDKNSLNIVDIKEYNNGFYALASPFPFCGNISKLFFINQQGNIVWSKDFTKNEDQILTRYFIPIKQDTFLILGRNCGNSIVNKSKNNTEGAYFLIVDINGNILLENTIIDGDNNFAFSDYYVTNNRNITLIGSVKNNTSNSKSWFFQTDFENLKKELSPQTLVEDDRQKTIFSKNTEDLTIIDKIAQFIH